MNILALDTTSTACSVALQLNGKISSLHRVAPMQQTNLLLPMIDELLTSSGVQLNELDAIAFGAGPGSFTGMRIASSVTQGLAFAANLPVIRISSLAAIALAAHQTMQKQSYLVALDARMGQIYWAHYVAIQPNSVELNGQEALCKPTEVTLKDATTNDCYGVGDGWGIYEEALTQALGFKPGLIDTTQLPTAEAVLKLALNEKSRLSAIEALPSYLIQR
jgi:tRNA threonylcarbamoyladenosine biosynthesis protein TsaB